MKVLIHILILNNLLFSDRPLSISEGSDFPVFYEKVVACKGHDKSAIYAEIAGYFNEQSVSSDADSAHLFISSDKLRIYNQVIGAIKNPAGEATFDIRVDVKDEKFRLTIYNPVFRPLKRDRYGKLVWSEREAEKVAVENFKHRLSLFRKIEAQLQDYIDDKGLKIKERMIDNELNTTNW